MSQTTKGQDETVAKMTIGTIGAGEVAQAFAVHLLKAGHEVLLSNSRGPSSLTQVVSKLGKGARAVTMDEAAKAPMVADSLPTTVTLVVHAAVQAPTAINQAYTTPANMPLTLLVAGGVLTGDSDPNNDPLTATLVNGPADGS
jgi:nucleoside-diphosphate-sugar epimerase